MSALPVIMDFVIIRNACKDKAVVLRLICFVWGKSLFKMCFPSYKQPTVVQQILRKYTPLLFSSLENIWSIILERLFMYSLVIAYLKHLKWKRISTGHLDLVDLSCLLHRIFRLHRNKQQKHFLLRILSLN